MLKKQLNLLLYLRYISIYTSIYIHKYTYMYTPLNKIHKMPACVCGKGAVCGGEGSTVVVNTGRERVLGVLEPIASI